MWDQEQRENGWIRKLFFFFFNAIVRHVFKNNKPRISRDIKALLKPVEEALSDQGTMRS